MINWSSSVNASKNPIVVSSCRCKEDVICQFKEVFSSSILVNAKNMNFQLYNVSLSLPSRRKPLHLQNQVDEMIDKLLENDIIKFTV